MSSPRPDTPPRAGSMPSGSPPPASPVLGSSSLSNPRVTIGQLVDDSLVENTPPAPNTPPRTNTKPHQESPPSHTAADHILDNPSHAATSSAQPSSSVNETSTEPTMADLYDSSPPRSPCPTENALQDGKTPQTHPRSLQPATTGGTGGLASTADLNEAALLRRLIRIRSPSGWSDKDTESWERSHPNETLRSLAMACCEMSEEEVDNELLRMVGADEEQVQLWRIIEARGLSQPQIDHWVRCNPGVDLRTLTMMATGMTKKGIEVELRGMRKEARERREGEAAVECGLERVEDVPGVLEGGEKMEEVEEDATEDGTHEWDDRVAGRDTDSSISSSEKREEKGKSVDQEAENVDPKTSNSTKRERIDQDLAEEMQLEEYARTDQHLSQGGPDSGAGEPEDPLPGDGGPGPSFRDESFISLDGATDSKDLTEFSPKDFVDKSEDSDRESSEQTKPTETPDMVKCDEMLARAMQENMDMTADDELGQSLSMNNGNNGVIQAPNAPVNATKIVGQLDHVSTQRQPTRADRRAARRATSQQGTDQPNTSSPKPFPIVLRRGALSQRGCSKPTRFPKKSDDGAEHSPALSLPNHNGAFRGRGQGARGLGRGNRHLVESTRGGGRPVRGDGLTNREFMGPRGGFNQGDISQRGRKQCGKGKRG